MLKDDPMAFAAAFASPAVYTSGGVVTIIPATIEDGDPGPGLDEEVRQAAASGLVRLGRAWVWNREFEALPSYGDTLEQSGLAWNVEFCRTEGDMVLIGISLGAGGTSIAIQERSDAEDASGFMEASFRTVATVPGMVRAVSGQETNGQDGPLASTAYRARIPSWPGLASSHRLLAGGRTLGIRAVLPRGPVMILECVEDLGRESR